MERIMCKSKLHRATVTQAELYYEGSVTIDADLLDAADILPYEKIQVVNINNGSRFESYAIEGKRRSGVICINGAAARNAAVGDHIIIITYANYNEEELKTFKPTIILMDKDNKIKDIKHTNEILEV
ncbi:MAG TPA: aspartate 1-decarboxylase [Ignavibacteria bacterium]|nr:aspartate 1-decarboxylase [Ignavibacteria bacterium]HAX49623.1 aspartate 1-decarboxylase [Bacteroidota bacterium]HRE11314.1 aspartate 1-decarboxylase [Ignavibacteria bacterium]HRF65666.1 aspartate 1-decarboxylase [Ignavibacteria bacterium]HRJ03302.1 aspartate 1-decarboxylase [Ignavibacteria bacterium]